jgi:hypothetical protein
MAILPLRPGTFLQDVQFGAEEPIATLAHPEAEMSDKCD